jgi:hypothetical protein
MVMRTINSSPSGYNLWPFGETVYDLPAYKFTTIQSDSGSAVFVKDPANGQVFVLGLHIGKMNHQQVNVCLPYYYDACEPTEVIGNQLESEMLRLGDNKDENLVKLEKQYTKALFDGNEEEQKRILTLIKKLVDVKKLMIVKPEPPVHNTTNVLGSPDRTRREKDKRIELTDESLTKKKLLTQIKGLIKRAEKITTEVGSTKMFTWDDYDKVNKLIIDHGSVSKETIERWEIANKAYNLSAKGEKPQIVNGKRLDSKPSAKTVASDKKGKDE